MDKNKIPKKSIERLILYRRICNQLRYEEVSSIYSHKLADIASSTPAQVRRDLMLIGYTGTPSKGYDVGDLEYSIAEYLDNPAGQNLIIVGCGRLGQSLAKYCYWKYPNLSKLFCFDNDEEKVGTEIHNCKILPVEDIPEIIEQEKIKVAILAIPSEQAQPITDKLVTFGITGILNYTSVRLIVPDTVFIEDLDMTLALERTSYYVNSK